MIVSSKIINENKPGTDHYIFKTPRQILQENQLKNMSSTYQQYP